MYTRVCNMHARVHMHTVRHPRPSKTSQKIRTLGDVADTISVDVIRSAVLCANTSFGVCPTCRSWFKVEHPMIMIE